MIEFLMKKADDGTEYFCVGLPPGYVGVHVHLSQCGHMHNRKVGNGRSNNVCWECSK